MVIDMMSEESLNHFVCNSVNALRPLQAGSEVSHSLFSQKPFTSESVHLYQLRSGGKVGKRTAKSTLISSISVFNTVRECIRFARCGELTVSLTALAQSRLQSNVDRYKARIDQSAF
jgi:hypothetical protein